MESEIRLFGTILAEQDTGLTAPIIVRKDNDLTVTITLPRPSDKFESGTFTINKIHVLFIEEQMNVALIRTKPSIETIVPVEDDPESWLEPREA